MDASIIEKRSHRRSPAGQSGQPAPSRARGPIYHTEAASRTRSVPAKPRSASQSDRPHHPSLSRVKGRRNMYTPPRMSPEISWLNDQSPVCGAEKTPPRHCGTPENYETPSLVNPSSALLQDLLKEQRASRGSRGPISDQISSTPDAARVQEDNVSTLSDKTRKVSDAFAAGQRKPKEMGMREMDQYVSKMNKLNFDLKLEIFHRSQQMKALEKKLECMKEMEGKVQRMHKLEEEVQGFRSAEKDNQGLRESNEQLRQELQKRDQAVTEAVQLICHLEAKIDEFETGGLRSQLSLSQLVLDGPNATTPKIPETVDVPQATSPRQETTKPQTNQSELRQLSKVPSFLRADNQSTATLRSLYAPENNKSHSALSELTKSTSLHTMNETLDPQSPRLSVLSEASELNPYDTPSRRNDFDKLNIPIRKAPSTESLDSYIPPSERESQKSKQVDQWLQSRPDICGTIIKRRQNRAVSNASKAESLTFNGELYPKRSQERPRLENSVFGGAKLPPTPDTMSTAYAAVNNGSNGSIAVERSPDSIREQWAAARSLHHHRSADELTSRRSFDGSDITDSMQTNCSDTPRLGMKDKESPTIFPFNTVAPKASELLGPGSPNNPALSPFGDLLKQASKSKSSHSNRSEHTPAESTVSGLRSMEYRSSPPLTPQDWLAAASRVPRSRGDQSHMHQLEQQDTEPSRSVISQAAFYDNQSIDSLQTEPDGPGIPTLDMNTLDILEHPVAEPFARITGPREFEPTPEPQKRRFSLRPSFLNRSTGPRRLQSSPMAPDYTEDEEDIAPAPVIRKHKTTNRSQRRPMSQIITDSADLYPSINSHTQTHETNTPGHPFPPKSLHHSFTETRLSNAPTQSPATISGRPSTSHSMDHKARRSSLGILGWMKNVSGKRPEPVTPTAVEPFGEQRARLVKDRPVTGSASGGSVAGSRSGIPRAGTPDSMGRPRSEISMYTDDSSRRQRYTERRVRRG